MSKPKKPGELRNVDVEAISMVSKAANGKRFKIFKSADFEEEKEAEAPEVILKDERGLFTVLKNFFRSKEVEKGAVTTELKESKIGDKLNDAFFALLRVLKINHYGGTNEGRETDVLKINSALDDFRDVAGEILLGKEEIIKSGRKISGSRLAKLKDIQNLIGEVLNGIDKPEEEQEEATEVSKDEVKEIVKESLNQIDVKKAVLEALDPLTMRIERLEKARGISNKVPEERKVEKDEGNFWGGIF